MVDLFLMFIGKDGLEPCLTKDFKNFTPIDDQISIPQGHKHGTIIEVPESVLLNLKAEEAKRFPQKD